MDAEAAANSAAIQLVSFKDTMEDEFAVCLLLHQDIKTNTIYLHYTLLFIISSFFLEF